MGLVRVLLRLELSSFRATRHGGGSVCWEKQSGIRGGVSSTLGLGSGRLETGVCAEERGTVCAGWEC